MKLRKSLLGALCALLSALGPAAAQDVGVETGAADDLTVHGRGGDRSDPDLDVKGYSAFATNAASAARVISGPGNVYIEGQLEVGRVMYAGTGGVVFADGTTQRTAAAQVTLHPLVSGECDTNRLDILVGSNYWVRGVKVWQASALGQAVNVYSNGNLVSTFALGGTTASQPLTLDLAAFDRLGIACTNTSATILFSFEGSRP